MSVASICHLKICWHFNLKIDEVRFVKCTEGGIWIFYDYYECGDINWKLLKVSGAIICNLKICCMFYLKSAEMGFVKCTRSVLFVFLNITVRIGIATRILSKYLV